MKHNSFPAHTPGNCDVPEDEPSDYGKHRSLFSYDNKKHEPECRCFLCKEDRNWR